MRCSRPGWLAGLLIGLAGLHCALAAELVIGVAEPPASADPHRPAGASEVLLRHLFDRLVHLDDDNRLRPGLAVGATLVDERTWELRLRPGVRFHDGSELTAGDVVATLERIASLSDSRPGLASRWRMRRTERIDDLTVRIRTEQPDPLVLLDAAHVAIISEQHAGAPAGAFGSTAPVGTGPYRLVEVRPGGAHVLQRNELYWGTKPEWLTVTLMPIEGATPRVEALLEGGVHFIERVPTLALGPFEQSGRVSVSRILSDRLIYLQLDQHRDRSPFVQAADGTRLDVNPLKDVRVRLALAKAIDRRKLVAEAMHGVGLAADQLMPEGRFGTSTEVLGAEHDPQGAVELLAQAGWEQGFQLVLHAPNGHYANDARVARALAGMFRRIGIHARAELLAPDIYFKRASRGGAGGTPEFSAMLFGWKAPGGEVSSVLRHVVHSYDRDRGLGLANRGRYASDEIDGLIEEALAVLDDQRRANLLARATELALADVAIIPLHFPMHAWVGRHGLRHRPRTDGATLAMDVYSE